MFNILRRRELEDSLRSLCQIMTGTQSSTARHRRISRCGLPLVDGYATQRNPEAFRFEFKNQINIMKKRKHPVVYRSVLRARGGGDAS